MSTAPTRSGLTPAELFERESLKQHVVAYLAVRSLPRCPVRDGAERRLSLALARFGMPFSCSGSIWRWSREEQSIMRCKAITHNDYPPRRSDP